MLNSSKRKTATYAMLSHVEGERGCVYMKACSVFYCAWFKLQREVEALLSTEKKEHLRELLMLLDTPQLPTELPN